MIQTAQIESCPECHERCIRIRKLEEVHLIGRGSLWEQVPEMIRYPIKGPGATLLVSGGIFFYLMDILIASAGFVGIFLAFMVTGYICTYMLSITAATAHGKTETPQWPEFTHLISLFEPIFQTLATFLLCAGPALLYFYNTTPPSPSIFWFLLGLGFFFWPMMWILLSLYGSLENLNPVLIVSSIAKVFKDYWLAYTLLLLCVYLRFSLTPFLNNYVPYLGGIFGNILSLYFLVLEMHLIGVLYLCNKKELDWSVSS